MPDNRDRAHRAASILDVYAQRTDDRESAAVDLLVDLMHWLDKYDSGFEAALDMAKIHYTAEIEEEK